MTESPAAALCRIDGMAEGESASKSQRARSHGQPAAKRSRGPTAILAIRPLTRTYW
jgi:hypothetical protein